MKLTIDFAFAGAEIIRKHPMAVLSWGVAYLVLSVVTTILTVVLGGEALATLMSYNQNPPSDPLAVFEPMGALAPIWAISCVLSLLVGAIIQCAVYRSQLQPQASGLGFMQLGGAEIRQIFVTILWILAIIVFYILFGIVIGILLAVSGAVSQSSSLAGGLMTFFTIGFAIVAFLYILSRWSLVAIQSFAEGRINIFGSFALTKGNGWILFGGYALLTIIALLVVSLIYAILAAVTMGTGGDIVTAFSQMQRPDLSSVQALFTPAYIVQTLVGAVLSGVFYALFYGASVAAYQALSAKKVDASAVF
ncbi:MAG: hypothetical protein QM667_00070 [Asticcacaulis sp.]